MTGAAVCTAHKGRHGVHEGRCVLVGRDVPRPFSFRASVCERCGASFDLRRSNADGSTVRLEAGTDRRHQHAPPVVVTFDQAELAGAIVAASRAARHERQPARREDAPIEHQSTMSGQRPANGRAALGGIPEFEA